MKNVLQELFLDLVHFINESNLLIIGLHDFMGVGLKQMLDAVHLKIVDAVLELGFFAFGLRGGKGAHGSTAGGGGVVLAFTENLTDVSRTVNTYMGREENHDVAVFWDVTTEGVPSGLTREWKSGEATEREDALPALLEEHGDVFARVVVIYLVRARAVTEECVIILESVSNKMRGDVDLANLAFEGSREESIQSTGGGVRQGVGLTLAFGSCPAHGILACPGSGGLLAVDFYLLVARLCCSHLSFLV